jgi:serine/threonine-protein kinase RsbW
MSSRPRRVEVTLETKVDSIDLGEELARRVALTAGFDEEEQHKISMAVRESLINAYQHGNQQDARKNIGLNFFLHPNRLVVEVSDQGKGFRLEEVPDPLAEEGLLRASGRGLFLIRSFMDECAVESRNGCTRLTLVKYLRTPAEPAPPEAGPAGEPAREAREWRDERGSKR